MNILTMPKQGRSEFAHDDKLVGALMPLSFRRLLHHAEAISVQSKSYRMKNWLATGKPKGATRERPDSTASGEEESR